MYRMKVRSFTAWAHLFGRIAPFPYCQLVVVFASCKHAVSRLCTKPLRWNTRAFRVRNRAVVKTSVSSQQLPPPPPLHAPGTYGKKLFALAMKWHPTSVVLRRVCVAVLKLTFAWSCYVLAIAPHYHNRTPRLRTMYGECKSPSICGQDQWTT